MDAAKMVAMRLITMMVVVLFSPGFFIPSWTLGTVLDTRYRTKKVRLAAIAITGVRIDANIAIFDRYESIMGNNTTSRIMLIVKSRVTSVNRVGSMVAIHRAVPLAT
jgi:hypothetical protein